MRVREDSPRAVAAAVFAAASGADKLELDSENRKSINTCKHKHCVRLSSDRRFWKIDSHASCNILQYLWFCNTQSATHSLTAMTILTYNQNFFALQTWTPTIWIWALAVAVRWALRLVRNVCAPLSSTTSCARWNRTFRSITIRTPKIWSSCRRRRAYRNACYRWAFLFGSYCFF